MQFIYNILKKKEVLSPVMAHAADLHERLEKKYPARGTGDTLKDHSLMYIDKVLFEHQAKLDRAIVHLKVWTKEEISKAFASQ